MSRFFFEECEILSAILCHESLKKIDEITIYIKKQIDNGNQVFWVCPLIEVSKKLDYSAAVKKYNYLSKIFAKKVGLIHGNLQKDEKDKVLIIF